MGVKALAEAIILQSMEDLSDIHHREDSLEFFSGEGFRICAQMAGMKPAEQVKVLKLVREISKIPYAVPKAGSSRATRVKRIQVPALFG